MINTWNESLLHEELKEYYRGETGKTEVPVGGSICDVVREDDSIVEIQTAQLGKLKMKLEKLLTTRRVTLVYPLARDTLIETWSPEHSLISRRKSPKHGTAYQIFSELTGLATLLDNANLSIEIVHSDILELRVADGTGSWRRKGVRKEDRKLIRIHETERFSGLADWARLLPKTLPEPFTVKELAGAGAGRHAGKMAWVLRKCGILVLDGKKGNAFLYRRAARYGGTKTDA